LAVVRGTKCYYYITAWNEEEGKRGKERKGYYTLREGDREGDIMQRLSIMTDFN
jgi:hypothetical protein